ncbi:MAG TPA: RagB/SusD family nutrient uptake outer membrane protein, partial [Lachnospiraceae bacterium]|nr:RagB/SusD family nutrient uptake outer membrane protein [Lachnospiraceae bacterium]
IDKNNGIERLDPDGHRFFEGAMIEAIISTKKEQEEIIWRKAIGATSYREAANYPPSLYGRGEVNPSQNLVDAFPCINGYPISDPRSGYNPEEPYANRDPRLALYIVYDGSKLKGNVIHTGVGGKVDAKDSIATSTRTGYYLRKMLREDVNLDPVSPAAKNHYDTHMRYTELYLSYAEAANEAWGPDGTGNHSYSARDVIRAIRKRAGISQPDLYVNSISTKEEMRKLIRNERRIELCFEGFRFWDLRRWKEDLTPTVKGVNIHGRTFDIVDVEERKYDNSYMHYAPLPEGEVLKFNALVQNKGW